MDLWKQYIWGKQSLAQLADQYKRSIPWIQKKLDTVPLQQNEIIPQPLVFIADVSFFARGDGVLVFRSPKHHRNVFWQFVQGENPVMYHEARMVLEMKGFTFQAIVLDGRKGIREVFSDIPVQRCVTSTRKRFSDGI